MADDKGRIRTPMSPATWTADEPERSEPEQPIDLRPPKTPEPAPPPAEQPAKKK